MSGLGRDLADLLARRQERVARVTPWTRARRRRKLARDRLRLASSALLPATVADMMRRRPVTMTAVAVGLGVLVGVSPTLRAAVLRGIGLGR